MKTILRAIQLAALTITIAPVFALEMAVIPSCPNTTAMVSLRFEERNAPPVILAQDPLLVRDGNSLKVTLSTTRSVFDPQPPTSLAVGLGQLPAGQYDVAVFRRYATAIGYEPEQFWTTFSFTVANTPGAAPCAASAIRSVSPPLLVSNLSGAFPGTFEFAVTDGQGHPIAGTSVSVTRLIALGEGGTLPEQQADAIFQATSVSTDTAGIARFTAVANTVAGTYQYIARIDGSVAPGASFALSNRSVGAALPAGAVPVVEYYNASRDHYFLTSQVQEQLLLDHSVLFGWVRTGGTFLAIQDIANSPLAAWVCRFYGSPAAGLDSHFYSAFSNECKDVLQKFPKSWLLETEEAFAIGYPNQVYGDCPAGTVPVFRLYNAKASPNHRYTTSMAVVESMNALGWVSEGYGNEGTVMCSF